METVKRSIVKLQSLIDESSNIVFFGGAGVSTESGIPDFRGKSGMYTTKKTDEYGRTPEYMLGVRCLYKEPELFFKNYRENMNCLKAEPNITHKYLKKLEDEGKLKAIITQNIDGLHQKAGSKNVYEIHGTMLDCYCIECNKKYPGEYIFETDGIPKCDCGGMVRPNIVLYGEMLSDCYSVASYLIYSADLLIVAGTSLTVQPANGLIKVFNGNHLVIINDSKTPYDDKADLLIHEPLGEVFSKLK